MIINVLYRIVSLLSGHTLFLLSCTSAVFFPKLLKKTLEQIFAGFHVLIFSFFLQEEKLIKGKYAA